MIMNFYFRITESQGSLISSDGSESLSKLPIITNLETVNTLLEKLEISKIPKRSVEDKKLIERKISEVGDAIRQKLKSPLVPSVGDMVLNQMKENFGTMAKNDQYRILTTMPPECSVEFLKTTFNTTDHQVKQAKAIQAEQGILSTPNPKPGRRLAEESLLKVKQFTQVMM